MAQDIKELEMTKETIRMMVFSWSDSWLDVSWSYQVWAVLWAHYVCFYQLWFAWKLFQHLIMSNSETPSEIWEQKCPHETQGFLRQYALLVPWRSLDF
jgi:hypothetical protein